MTSKAYRAACSYILGLLDAQTEFEFALKKAIWYCEKRFPQEDFQAFKDTTLIKNEVNHLKEWFSELLGESSPPEDLSILWFYLICENSSNGYNIDFCFAGDKKQELEKFGVCLIESPDYLPLRHLAHSKLLEAYAKTIEQLSFGSKFFTEYMLGMTYSSFAARELADRFTDRLAGEMPKVVKAGFRLGDAITVGTIKNGNFLM